MPEPLPTSDLSVILARLADTLAAPAVVPEALDRRGAATFCGVSPAKWDELNRSGLSPLSIDLGTRCPRWLRGELLAWLRAGAPARSRWVMMRDSALRRVG